MRTHRLTILPAFIAILATMPASADNLDENLNHVVMRDQLVQKRALAHERCIRDVPDSAQWLADPAISNFCLARYGSKRLDALFLGVRLSARLDSQGNKAAAKTVEALLVSLEDPDVSPPLMTKR